MSKDYRDVDPLRYIVKLGDGSIRNFLVELMFGKSSTMLVRSPLSNYANKEFEKALYLTNIRNFR